MLLAARSALDSLSVSMERIQELIIRLQSLLDDGVLANSGRPRARGSYGGGPSPLAPRRAGATRGIAEPTQPNGWPARDPVSGPVETPPAPTAPTAPAAPRVTARELIVVSELAHAGYSRREIAERLRAQWGDQAAIVLREALGESRP